MFITIPVYWAEDEWEKKEDLGMDVESTIGDLNINVNLIVAHHVTDDGGTMIRLANGECFKSPVIHADFKEMINQIHVAIELKATKN